MEELKKILEKLNIDDGEAKCAKLESYMHGVLEWNEKVNLTAITEEVEFVQKHYVDSLLCSGAPEFLAAKSVIDVGTGGGFPGVPLAVCFPEKSFVLMDSLAKRLRIVKELCERIGIENIEVVHGRAEELGRQKGMRDSFDLCVSRAVANMSTLSEYCLPFVREGGCFIAYKGSECEAEVDSAARAIELLSGELIRLDSTKPQYVEICNGADKSSEDSTDKASQIPFEHKLIYVKKLKPTPKAYPRKAGTPSRKPL